MNLPYILAVVGALGYFVNTRIINYYMRIKMMQMQEQSKQQRRRSSENRAGKSKLEGKLAKEVPKLKWTVWFGFAMAIMCAVGVVWSAILLLMRLF
ncbi:MAG: hypothetical protein IJP30_02380 [Clostridia bacterium]|nr:hypothetical protein [Clostridia bacterium]